MLQYPYPIQRAIEELQRLPGIGPKSAQRLALHILRSGSEAARSLGEAISSLPAQVRLCPICGNYTDVGACAVCDDARRDRSLLCVVAEVSDLMALERSGEYHGMYHVLGGVLSPLEGIGPDELKIQGLLQRIAEGDVTEVILATSPSVEGDATAEYLRSLLQQFPAILVSRIALGLPVGADLDYQDQVTVARALSGRRQMQ
jgi:recombination protein RecR